MIWKADRIWAASMVGRRACRSLRTEAQRSRASFATRGDRNSRRTKRVLNSSTGKIGATIRLAIRNSDSPPARRGSIWVTFEVNDAERAHDSPRMRIPSLDRSSRCSKAEPELLLFC
jgi:hypothetical protein